ncbi:hypothetical protein HMPREF0262_01215 [Clostridium sp. ATCC 29733]|nr:hypothetical protein HMPREF0262_01215 [Clostridium sp. ATCC 29733]
MIYLAFQTLFSLCYLLYGSGEGRCEQSVNCPLFSPFLHAIFMPAPPYL